MAYHLFIVAVALVAINARCTAVTVIIRSIGKDVHFVIAFFLAAVINLKITKVLVGHLICSATSGVSFSALSATLQLKT
eukprot:10074667-Ditylum_brightwellii.AAC.1